MASRRNSHATTSVYKDFQRHFLGYRMCPILSRRMTEEAQPLSQQEPRMFHANRNIPRPASMPLRIAMFFALTTFALTARLYAGYDPCGTVNCHSAYIGYSSGSTGTATVDGAGSKLKAASSFGSNNPNLYVGYSGTGTLNVTNGGVVSSDYCSYIGDLAGSNGTARGRGNRILVVQLRRSCGRLLRRRRVGRR